MMNSFAFFPRLLRDTSCPSGGHCRIRLGVWYCSPNQLFQYSLWTQFLVIRSSLKRVTKPRLKGWGWRSVFFF